MLGLPAASGVSFTTGATVANLTALAAARHRVLDRAGWDVEADGLVRRVRGLAPCRRRLRPVGAGRARATRAHRGRAAYLPDESAREPYLHGLEASRRARGGEVFAALRSLGREGVARMIEGCCRHAERLAEGLRAAGHEVLNEVVLNQVVVDFGDAAANAAVTRRVQRGGVCWCGPTHWQERDAMRISVSGWATSADDVERSLESILACAADVLGRGDAARAGTSASASASGAGSV